jgi:F-type H+-transporting ATPase subunit delta
MSKDPLSSSYAGALIELASDRGELEAVNEQASAFLAVLRDNPDFRVFLMTPSVDPREKNKVLDTVFADKFSATLLDFIELVLTKRRQVFLEGMLDEFQALFEDKMGRLHVEVVSAIPLAEADQSNLSDVLSKKLNKTIVLENAVDPIILGGLVLRYGDLVVDGSVRTRLESVASRLKNVKLGSELVHEN